MKPPKKQAAKSKSQSSEGRKEATARGQRIRAATDLSHSPDFDLQYGEDYRGGRPCSYYTLQYRGVKAHLRFDYMWTARCPSLGIEKLFLNQPPQDLAKEIEDWIDQSLPATKKTFQSRQATPAVQGLAQRHGISVSIADELMVERSF